MTKREARKRNQAWQTALAERRVLKIGETTFRSYPTQNAVRLAFLALRAQGIPCVVVQGDV